MIMTEADAARRAAEYAGPWSANFACEAQESLPPSTYYAPVTVKGQEFELSRGKPGELGEALADPLAKVLALKGDPVVKGVGVIKCKAVEEGAWGERVQLLQQGSKVGRAHGLVGGGGMALNAPYGLGSKYDEDWVGRYHAIKSKLFSITATPTVAWRPLSWLTLGGGVSAQYIHAELTNALDFGTIGAVLQNRSGQALPITRDDTSVPVISAAPWAILSAIARSAWMPSKLVSRRKYQTLARCGTTFG